MSLIRSVNRQQRRWAHARGIKVDSNGFVADYHDNLFLPISAGFDRDLAGAGGAELKPQRNLPSRLHALQSSAALAINVFQYWEGCAGPELPRALGFDGSLESIRIERPFGTGLEGTPPSLDAVLVLTGNRLVAIESKFTEWMTTKRPRLDYFRAKYLAPGTEIWRDHDLPGCQRLATDIANGSDRFRQLDALQLLKHALGLVHSAPGAKSLFYLYYDAGGLSAAPARHREELARFTARVDPSLDFRAMSYQALFAKLYAFSADSDYAGYLKARYFPAGVLPEPGSS